MKPCKRHLTNHMWLLKIFVVILRINEVNDLYPLITSCVSLVNVSFYKKGNIVQASMVV